MRERRTSRKHGHGNSSLDCRVPDGGVGVVDVGPVHHTGHAGDCPPARVRCLVHLNSKYFIKYKLNIYLIVNIPASLFSFPAHPANYPAPSAACPARPAACSAVTYPILILWLL